MSAARDIAGRFVAARQAAQALPEFPGELPASLAVAYRVQEQAIALWPDEVAGWKIGRVPAHQVQDLGADRLAGPIFRRLTWRTEGAEVAIPVFEGGFAAVEAECVLSIARDVPPEDADWTRDDALALVGAMRIGVETAGSPLASINELGATAVVSDFGNNHGLVLGPQIADWRALLNRGLSCETSIDGVRVGSGVVRESEDDPLDALVFLLEHLARRGRTLQRGHLVSTGAVTGVHDIEAGQRARVKFDQCGELRCVAVKAVPSAGGFT